MPYMLMALPPLMICEVGNKFDLINGSLPAVSFVDAPLFFQGSTRPKQLLMYISRVRLNALSISMLVPIYNSNLTFIAMQSKLGFQHILYLYLSDLRLPHISISILSRQTSLTCNLMSTCQGTVTCRTRLGLVVCTTLGTSEMSAWYQKVILISDNRTNRTF